MAEVRSLDDGEHNCQMREKGQFGKRGLPCSQLGCLQIAGVHIDRSMVSIRQAVTAGKGIYTISEAALYARLHPQTLRRWLLGGRQSQNVLGDDVLIDDGEYVGFLDFIQALAVHAIRTEFNISLQKIRDAVKLAQDEFGLQHPLAKKHATYVLGKDLYIVPEGESNPVQSTGKNKGQIQMKKVLEVFLTDVSWDADLIAQAYRPFGMDVLMDPRVNFGEPVVSSCGIPAIALRDAVETEGDFKSAAEAHGVTEDDVVTACRFFDLVEGRPAA